MFMSNFKNFFEYNYIPFDRMNNKTSLKKHNYTFNQAYSYCLLFN